MTNLSFQVSCYFKELVKLMLGKEDKTSLAAQLVRGGSGTFLINLISTGLILVSTIVLTHLLGASRYGVYAYVISWITLLSLPGVLGFDTLLTREIARYKTKSDWNSLNGLLRCSNRIVLLSSTGIAILIAGVVWLFREKLGAQTAYAFWAAILILPFLSMILLRQGAIKGLSRVVASQLPQYIILPLVFLALVGTVYLIVGDISAHMVLWIRTFAAVIAFLFAIGLTRKYWPQSAKEVIPKYRKSEWLKSSLTLCIAGSASIVNQQISVVMLGSMIGPEEAGIFDVARKIVIPISFVLAAVNMPLAPAIAGLYAKGDMQRLQHLITKSARLILITSFPIALAFIMFGNWILYIFGKEFSGGGTALAILCVGQLINAGMGSVAILLNMTSHEQDTVRGIVIAAVINVTLNAVLIPIWELEGAAVANTISMVTWNVLLAMWVYKRLGIYSTAFGARETLS